MLGLWVGTLISLLLTIGNHYERNSRRLECGNHTSGQLFKGAFYQRFNSSFTDHFDLNVEQCFAPVVLVAFNLLITLSTFRHWFQLSLFQKWFSLDYLLNLLLLLCLYGWSELVHYRPRMSWYLIAYLTGHALQALLAVWHEFHYYGRYLHLSLAVEDPLFDSKIIAYSIVKIIYMCSFLVAHRYPQNRCAAFSYQLYKWTLLFLAQFGALCVAWCYLRAQWLHTGLDAHVALATVIAVLMVFCFAWRTERTLLLTYPLLGLLWMTVVVAGIQLALSGQWSANSGPNSSSGYGLSSGWSGEDSPPLSRSDEALREVLRTALDFSKSDEELSDERRDSSGGLGASGASGAHHHHNHHSHGRDLNGFTLVNWAMQAGWLPAAIAGCLLLLLSCLAIQFARAFKQQRAYADLFAKECTKMLTQVLDQCRNKEYFVIKYNFKIKYKCCACGSLSLDLVCPDCHQAIFQSGK